MIGLVGKTGAGKSTAATLLAQMGCTVIDADKIARELTQPNAPILQTLADVFGKDILANGILNRALLASRAFADETARQKLNAVMHPAVMARITEMIDALPRGATAVIDAAALLETALKPDHLIVIDASEEIRLRRVMVRDGITAESAMERIRAQKNLVFPNENTAFRTIIQNDDLPIGELKIQLKEALQRMVFAKTSAPTWLVVGLGNPGKQYEYTRHNAGFLCLDLLANNCGAKINKLKFHALHGFCDLNGTRCLLLRPQTFMNNSGLAVREAAAYFDIPPARVLVLFDDISLPCGGLRIRRGGSDGGHNGIKSMIAALDTNAFPRVKIGVGNRPHPDFDLIDWVLSVMTTSERAQLREACEKAADAAKLIVSDNMEAAMAKYNAKCQD
ncbi:MAG: aminoacyl-tRNA hydrolase [Oscillospiraceae bacterium]|nr:aminoacyl-tRNA hydrolase [Oscillospiraceae bacterium]